jgi:vacuolar-type H+-ATPase subunit F/Vma7
MSAEERTSGTVVAIGEPSQLAGYALVGAAVVPARTAAAARAAWQALPDGVGLVLLTAAAAQAVGSSRDEATAPLTVVTPG